jgi:hypothetical protein
MTAGKIEAVPYHIAYQRYLKDISTELRKAGSLTSDVRLAGFLSKRADALLTDEYFESDLDWVQLGHPGIDVIVGPHESYIDRILGMKTAYEGAVLVRNRTLDGMIDRIEPRIPELQNSLQAYAPRPRHSTPLVFQLEVADVLFRSGDLRHGYQSVAVSLPNDPAIHWSVGTKSILFKNIADVRFSEIIEPLAREILAADTLASIDSTAYGLWMLLHEVAHALSAAPAAEHVSVRHTGTMSTIEEAKADLLGLFSVDWLAADGSLSPELASACYASFVAGVFRVLRYKNEVHARAANLEMNYLIESGGVLRLDRGFAVDRLLASRAVAELVRELMSIQATSDSARAERLLANYGKPRPDIVDSLSKLAHIPIDIFPTFAFPDFAHQK